MNVNRTLAADPMATRVGAIPPKDVKTKEQYHRNISEPTVGTVPLYNNEEVRHPTNAAAGRRIGKQTDGAKAANEPPTGQKTTAGTTQKNSGTS